ncbi:MAG: metal-sensing transcriptional repressor [Lachnospiraceae bacterium]|nr:metal-sensing transcriptional repressor [Lachnospiraceae bacterium]
MTEEKDKERSAISGDYSKLTEIRAESLKKNLNTRLNRLEGQMKGVKQMVENDRYYADLVIQGISMISSLKSFCRVIMEDHLQNEVIKGLGEGGGKDEKVKEFTELMQKVMG